MRWAALPRQEAAHWLSDYTRAVIMRGGRAGFQGASDVGEQVVCAECSEAIDVGAGRFNISSRSYHVKCYDASRHLTVPESA